MRTQILIYNMNDAGMLRRIKFICARLKCKSCVVDKKDYNKTIGYILGEVESTPIDEATLPDYEGNDLQEPMLVLAGLSSSLMDQMLAALRKEKLVIPYKASVTPTNLRWSAVKLYTEIAAEHARMHGE